MRVDYKKQNYLIEIFTQNETQFALLPSASRVQCRKYVKLDF